MMPNPDDIDASPDGGSAIDTPQVSAAVDGSENRSSEIDLLRRVASAARWAIDSNGDDRVGRDGRARVGLNWISANIELNRAIKALAEHYPIAEQFEKERLAAGDLVTSAQSRSVAKHARAA